MSDKEHDKVELDPKTLAIIQAMGQAMMAPIIASLRQLSGPQQLALPAARALPARRSDSAERSEIKRLIGEHCDRTRERFDDAQRRCHLAFDDGRSLATAKATPGGKVSGLDVVESNGELGAFLDVVRRELPNGPRLLELLPSAMTPRPTRQRAPKPGNDALRSALAASGMSAGQLATASGLSSETIARALDGYVPGRAAKRKIAGALAKNPTDLWA